MLIAVLAASSVPGAANADAAPIMARRDVAITRSAVRLSDLFLGLDPSQDCEIGPAPGPGRSITVPEPQLSAIAAQFGVDWRPMPGFVATTLRRSGRAVSRDEVLAVLTPALLAATGRTDAQVVLLPFGGPTLPAEVTVTPEIQQLDVGKGDGRFSAILGFTPPDADPVSLRVSGHLEDTVDGLVLTRPLQAGSVLTPDDLAPARLSRERATGTPLNNPAEAIGLQIVRSAPAGTPVSVGLLSHPPVVTKNHPVVLRLQQDGLTLTVSGLALESGTLGDTIHVLNTGSHAVLLGRVMDGTDIRIEPGTSPVPAGGRADQSGFNSSGRVS